MSDVPMLTSPLLAALPGVRHAFFTRQGGVSEGVYASLNVGRGSGDDPAHVAENRRRAAGALGVRRRARCSPPTRSTRPTRSSSNGPSAPSRREGDARGHRDAGPGLRRAGRRLRAGADRRRRGAASSPPSTPAGAARWAAWSARRSTAMTGWAPSRRAWSPRSAPASARPPTRWGWSSWTRFAAATPRNERFFAPGAAADKRLFDLPAFVLVAPGARPASRRAEWIGRDTYAEPDLVLSPTAAPLHRGEADYGRLLSAITLAA